MDNNNLRLERKGSAQLAARLTKELVDDNLMQKYGTSLDINMQREYQKYLDKKYHVLRAEFDKINKNQDEFISKEELMEFVNSYSAETGKSYSQGYINKLFSLIDKDNDEKLTIQEFIESYMILEEKLRLKKIKLTKLDDDLRSAKEKYYKGMIDNKGEKTNIDEMADNSCLNVSLLEAKDLRPMNYKGTSDSYVILTLGNKKMTSAYRQGTLTPIWNEDFSFAVLDKKLVLDITVWHRDTFKDEIHGSVKIPLSELSNQLKIEKEFELIPIGKDDTFSGTIRLRLQFLFSRYKYFTDLHAKTEDQINRLQEDITELNKYFDLFEKPFGILLYGEVNTIMDRRILQRSEDLASYAASNRRSVYMTSPRGFNKGPRGLAFKLESVIKGTFKKNNIEWSKLSLIMMYSVVICSCVSLFGRSDFVGLFVGVAIWALFIHDKKTDILEYLKMLLYTILATIFYDFFWLYLHSESFFKGSNYDNAEGGLSSFAYFISIVNFISKIILLATLWIQHNHAVLKERNSIKPSINSNRNNNVPNNESGIHIGSKYEPSS